MIQKLDEYIQFVSTSDKVGKLEKLAVQRFENDLKREDIIYNEKEVKEALEFISIIRHYTGRHKGKPFLLEGWQIFIVANIIGFRRKGTNRRRYTESYIEVSRKNGKTALVAALALLFLIGLGEHGAECDFAANSVDQANIAFNMVKKYIKSIDPTGKLLKPQHKIIKFDATDSEMKVFASDDSKLDGFNASLGIVDEYHAAPNSRVKDVIKSSQGMRENPHQITITTAGYDIFSVCYQLRTVCVEILHKKKKNDSLFALIFSLDEDNEDERDEGWKDPANFRKTNPNVGITVYEDYLREEIESALADPTKEVGIRTKNFNQWLSSVETWIAHNYILKATPESFEKIQFPPTAELFVGVDLASTDDLAAVSYMHADEEAGTYTYRTDYYVPEEKLKVGARVEQYKLWYRQGLLKVTPGNVTDYDYITADLKAAQAKNHIQVVSYDSYNATQWAIQATYEGLWLVPYSQSIGNFNKPTKALKRQLKKGNAILENNEITRFCFRNVTIRIDHNGNEKPDKAKSADKIDGVISMIQALGGFFQYKET